MIIAQYTLRDKVYPVKIIETYPTPQGTKAVIETLDQQASFFTCGSKVAKFTPWTTTNLENLQDVQCTHERTFVEFSGFHRPYDDLVEHEYCQDCGEEIFPPVPVYMPLEANEEIPF